MSVDDAILFAEKATDIRFLVVEDDPEYAAFLEAQINACAPTNEGIDIVEGAEKAISLLTENPYDVCFLDYYLKDGTGLDVMQAVSGRNLMTAFVFVTVDTRKETAFQALTLGAMDYLIKAHFTPFDLSKSIAYSLYRKSREIRLQAEALKDSLTGLGNRNLFNEQLHQAIARAKRDNEKVGVLMIDLDRFKPVNDRHGHQAGDALLKQVAERIVGETRSSDVVARLGGDEFAAVLIRVSSREYLNQVRNKLATAINGQPYEVGKHWLKIGASVGASLFPDDTDNIHDLVHMADVRMYEEKEKHHNAADQNLRSYRDVVKF